MLFIVATNNLNFHKMEKKEKEDNFIIPSNSV